MNAKAKAMGGSLAHIDAHPGAVLRAWLRGPRTAEEKRFLDEGIADSAGGYAVPTITATQILDRVRAALVLAKAGSPIYPLTSDTVIVPKVLTDPTFMFKLEDATFGERDPTFGAVTFSPQTCGTIVRVSRELLEDAAGVEEAR